jgi:hypothetical protein
MRIWSCAHVQAYSKAWYSKSFNPFAVKVDAYAIIALFCSVARALAQEYKQLL